MTFLTGIFPFYLQRRAQTKIKIRQTCANQIWHFFSYLFIYFKMSDKSDKRKNAICLIFCVNVKEYWADLAEKYSQLGAKITTIIKLSWKY